MTMRNALRAAIASGHARDVKAVLNDNEQVLVLKQYLLVPDEQLVAHLRRLADELGAEQAVEAKAT